MKKFFGLISIIALLAVSVSTPVKAAPGVSARVLFSAATLSPASYTQLFAASAITRSIKEIQVYNSSINPVQIAAGAASSEVVLAIAPAHGSASINKGASLDSIPLSVSGGTRLSIRALDSSISAGDLVVNIIHD